MFVGGEQQSTEICTGTRGEFWLPPVAFMGAHTTCWFQDNRQKRCLAVSVAMPGQCPLAYVPQIGTAGMATTGCTTAAGHNAVVPGQPAVWCRWAVSVTLLAQCLLVCAPQAGAAVMFSGSSPGLFHMCKMHTGPQNINRDCNSDDTHLTIKSAELAVIRAPQH